MPSSPSVLEVQLFDVWLAGKDEMQLPVFMELSFLLDSRGALAERGQRLLRGRSSSASLWL